MLIYYWCTATAGLDNIPDLTRYFSSGLVWNGPETQTIVPASLQNTRCLWCQEKQVRSEIQENYSGNTEMPHRRVKESHFQLFWLSSCRCFFTAQKNHLFQLSLIHKYPNWHFFLRLLKTYLISEGRLTRVAFLLKEKKKKFNFLPERSASVGLM